LRARRAAARGLPAELPEEDVENLSFLGRTWYVHGVDYWFRRAVIVVLALVGILVASAMEYGLFSVADSIGSPAGRLAWRAGIAVLLVASLIRPARTAIAEWRRRHGGQLMHPDLPPGARAVRPGGGAGMGALARTGNTAAGAALVLGVVLFYGWFVYFLAYTLFPEYDVEYDARRRLQQRHLGTATAPTRDP